MTKAYVAFDLGAESGRAMLGVLDGGKLTLHEMHRFANVIHHLPDGFHWNTVGWWANLKEGLAKAVAYCKDNDLELTSVGVDTWGVDFGLLGKSGSLLGLPWVYRDPRNEAAMDKAIEQIGAERLYDMTGLQFMPFNTLYQLVALKESEPAVLDAADRLQFTPDLLHYFFTGNKINESSIASTSQMIDPRTGQWANGLLNELGIPSKMLGDVVPPGTVVGTLRKEVADETGASTDLQVITPATHDTASAVAAVPADATTNWMFLSSGTWSLMGLELDEPIISEAARAQNYTNEGGVNGTIRFLKNISGLWLVQEVRRAYEKQGESYDYDALTRMAGEAEPFRTLVDPDHSPFLQPGDMPGKIAAFAEATDQPKPETPGQFVRCCLESLAMTYRRTLEGMIDVTGKAIDVIHIVGGGGKNELLNQMTADATNRTVIVGPYEATAVGNLLVQAMGAGDLKDLDEIRQVVKASFQPRSFEPADTGKWDDAYGRYTAVLDREA